MNNLWASRGPLALLLVPVALLFGGVVWVRSALYKTGVLQSKKSDVPVIVVGNISVGGTGKTPIVGVLVKKLQDAGFRPGIVSRGYGALTAREPRLISAETLVEWAGDEPSMLARQTGVPICLCIARSEAVACLLRQTDVNVIISDDGLQHYAMARDIEIAVVDGQRLLGNGFLMPAGPLREPKGRMSRVAAIAVQHAANTSTIERAKSIDSVQLKQNKSVPAGSFHLDIVTLLNLHTNEKIALSEFTGKAVHAVAGVGNPQRFFTSLTEAGLEVNTHAMEDHHQYVPENLQFNDDLPILMTSKDAVKVRELDINLANMFEVSVVAVLDEELNSALDEIISSLT